MSSKSSFELLLKRIDGEDELTERRLRIDETTTIHIGRASKTEQKKLTPAVDNGWIRNPVISRTHAVLSLATLVGKPTVIIQDKKSSHGTFVNGENIKENKHPLKNGDMVRFGSEVMRGEETFRPPVFNFEISPLASTSVTDTAGVTITVPDESAGESDADEEISSEDSISSVHALDNGFGMSQSHPGNVLGSQGNPWTIDEADMAPIGNEIVQVYIDDEAESVDEDFDEMEEDVSSESNISEDEVEDESQDPLDVDDDAIFGFQEEDDSQDEDDESDEVAQSPIYTPKSPKYSAPEAESSGPVRGYTPPQFTANNSYLDGPFAYGWARPQEGWFSTVQDWTPQTSNRAPPLYSLQEAAIPHTFSAAHSLPATNSAPNVTLHNSVITSTTSEMLDQTRRTFSKADMSINNLINPSPGKELNSATKKRKADELENDEEETMMENAPADTVPVVIDLGNPPHPAACTIPVVVNTENAVEQAMEEPASISKESVAVTSSQAVSVPTPRAEEPPRKKQRTAAARALFFGAGVLAGGIATLGTLISLPDGYFQ